MTSDEEPAEDNLAAAQRRAERMLENGATVVGPSMQAFFVGLSVMWVIQAVSGTSEQDGRVWFSVLGVLGFLIAVTGWLVARRRNLLQPFPGTDLDSPWQVFSETERKAIGAQLRGRAPVVVESAPVVRAMLLWQRRVTRALLPTLAGAGLCLIAAGGATPRPSSWSWPWLSLIEVAAVVSMAAMATVETRRRGRVLRHIAGLGALDRAHAEG